MKASAGTITTRYYDDGIAKGVQILLDDTVVAMLDVFDPSAEEMVGEARVLVYHQDCAEPIECITINR